MKLHMELEEQIAAFKNVEACVVFSQDSQPTPEPFRRFWEKMI